MQITFASINFSLKTLLIQFPSFQYSPRPTLEVFFMQSFLYDLISIGHIHFQHIKALSNIQLTGNPMKILFFSTSLFLRYLLSRFSKVDLIRVKRTQNKKMQTKTYMCKGRRILLIKMLEPVVNKWVRS